MDDRVELTVKKLTSSGHVSRRDFVRTIGVLAALMSIPQNKLLAAFTQSLAKNRRLPVIWLEFQDCTGDTESVLRGAERSNMADSTVTDPGIVDLLLSVIALEYHETIMSPSGAAAEKSRNDVIAKYKGKYLTIVEGSIPTAANGNYCTVGGKTAMSIAKSVCSQGAATVALGTCAVSGGLGAAAPNPTGAKGVLQAFPTMPNVLNLPGCPANVVNVVSTIVYFIAYGKLPALDSQRRPSFAYGKTIHSQCPRRDYYEDGPHVLAWGDAAHRSGGCMVKMGCRGPNTYSNCPTARWNGGAGWPVESGHGCFGCTTASFWDANFPYYKGASSGDSEDSGDSDGSDDSRRSGGSRDD